jgi:D-alanyl-D-alanine carboxypeptidase
MRTCESVVQYDGMKKFLLPSVLVIAIVAASIWLISNEASAPSNSSANQQQVTSQSGSNASKPSETSFDKAKYSTDDPDSIWVVVNKQRPLDPKNYAPSDLTAVGGGQRLRAEAATALATLIADAKTSGLYISSLSGYRSYGTQVSVYNNEVATNGQATADTQSARPGYSEHQTGLAIDVGGGGCGIEDCFGDTDEGKWVAENAYRYGFIIRYMPGKESITGYRAEPWHIRYIGVDLATEMKKQNVQTLEEFFGLSPAPSY